MFEVSIVQSCDSIINPEAPLALRLSGQLLLGVVRIYQRKLTFLETDAKNAIDGLQRKEGVSQNVDLPDGGTAPEMAITLPDAEPGLFGGTELFPSFAIGDSPGTAAGGVALAARLSHGAESLTFADDISDVLGSSRWTASEERFDVVGGEDLDRRFSAELERLRSAAAVEAPRGAASDLFFDAPMDDSYGPPAGGMDEIMEPPAEDLFVMPPLDLPGPTPGSVGGAPLPGTADIQFTPPSLGAFDGGLPDIDGPLTDLSLGGGADGATPTPNRGRNRQAQKRKKRVQIDVAPDGTDASQLPSEEMRKLMNDRTPLLRNRGTTTTAADKKGAPEPPPRFFDVRAQSEAARDSYMYRPACSDRLAPDLLAIFNRALGVSANGKHTLGPRRAGAAAEPADPFAASPAGFDAGRFEDDGAHPAYSNGGAGAQSPGQSWGGFDDGGPADSGGYYPDVDHIENFPEDGAGGAGEGDEFGSGGGGGTMGMSDGRGGLMPLELTTMPRDGSAPASLGGFGDPEFSEGGAGGVSGGEPGVGGGLAADGFTARTKVVLDHLTQRFMAPASGSKRRHTGAAAGTTPAVESLALDTLVAGRPRLEACRWFFEALVLRNKGYVDLQQEEPYGEIKIMPLAKLIEGQGAGGQA